MIERDKIHVPVWAPPVEVRNLQIDFESLREGVQLDVICFFLVIVKRKKVSVY